MFCWKNLLAETGTLQFEKVTGNGLACEARLRYDREQRVYVPAGKAPGLPYLTTADVDNDGLMDVLAVGPASPGWAPRAEYVGGRFWRNLGDFRFEEQTRAVGLGALEWTFRDWVQFFDQPVDGRASRPRPGKLLSQPGRDRPHPLDQRPYFADAAFADFDNSGIAATADRYESKVYWNTGLHGGRQNYWLRLRFSGVSDAELIGAQVKLVAGSLEQTRWIHPHHSYKSSGALEAHFGLGPASTADVTVTLLDVRSTRFPAVAADRTQILRSTPDDYAAFFPSGAGVCPQAKTRRCECRSERPCRTVSLSIQEMSDRRTTPCLRTGRDRPAGR